MRIQVSQSTRALLETAGGFVCEHRGQVRGGSHGGAGGGEGERGGGDPLAGGQNLGALLRTRPALYIVCVADKNDQLVYFL